MKKVGLVTGLIVLISSVFGQQFLWSTVQNGASKNVSLENVTKEVLTFYDQYEYYFDLTGFSKDRFLEFVEKFEIKSEDWKNIKTNIYGIEDLTVFALRDNLGRGSIVFVMCIDKENVNMLLFSNTYEQDARKTHQFDREKFSNWFRSLNNNEIGLDKELDYHSSRGSGMGSGKGIGTGEGSGAGIGYGSANRGYVNIPDVNLNANGTVHVEVQVTAQGSVINARILNTPKYPTTITNSKIQQECIERALSAKYVAGKEELRIIVFK